MESLCEPETKVRYVDTRSAYDRWATVYDTDGNFLQILDTLEMRYLLPKAVSLIGARKPWKLVDLGCGTGRNTVHLLDISGAEVVALDLSANMLEIARKRLEEKALSLKDEPTFRLASFDVLESTPVSQVSINGDVDLVISTLVVEHIPLPIYFRTVSDLLKRGGLLVLTNMHSELGNLSQAGFLDTNTGEKIRPKSYAHTIDDIVTESARCGFEVTVPFKEQLVDERNCSELGPRARKWMGIKVWYGGILRKER